MRRIKHTNFILLGTLLFIGFVGVLYAVSDTIQAQTYPENTWTPINWELSIRNGALPEGTDPSVHHRRGNHWFGGMTYKPSSGEAIIFDGYFSNFKDGTVGGPSIFANSLYGMNPVSGDYTLYKVGNYRGDHTPTQRLADEWTPAPRHTYDYWTYAPETNSVYMIKGANKRLTFAAEEDTKLLIDQYCPAPWVREDNTKRLGMWRYSFDDDKWYSLHDSGIWPETPSQGSGFIYVPSREKIYLFPTTAFSDDKVYSFDVNTEMWQEENVDFGEWREKVGNYFLYSGALFYDSHRDRVMFYSGKSTKDNEACHLGAFDPATNNLSVLDVEGAKPPAPRYHGGIVYNSKHDLYVAFGGAGEYTDNWIFDPTVNQWRKFEPEQNIPLSDTHSHLDMVYDSKNDLTILTRATGGPGEWFAMRFNPNTANYLDNEPAPEDTSSPVIRNGAPSGELAFGTTNTTLSVETSESATCKYSTQSGVSYGSMSSVFSTTGGTGHEQTVSGLSWGNTYTYYVRCQDEAGNANTSDYSVSFSVASEGDTEPPTTPTNLSVSTVSDTQITLNWNDASDNTGVAGYRVYRGGALIDTVSNSQYTDTGLSADTTYTYTVAAYDSADNMSDTSSPISATTHTADQSTGGYGVVTDFTVRDEAGVTTSNYPITFGHPFRKGDVPSGANVALKMESNGTLLDTQFECKRTWPDNSCKHAVISAVLPRVEANADVNMQLVQGSDIVNQAGSALSKTAILNTNVESDISLSNISGSDYSGNRSVSLRDTISSGTIGNNPYTGSDLDYWLSGSVCTEILARAPIMDNSGRPQMNGYWEARFYPDSDFGPRISVSVENVEAHYRGDVMYDLSIRLGETNSEQVYTKTGVDHSYQSRWRKVFWLGNEPPDVELRYNTDYLISTKMVMNYDTSLSIPERVLSGGGVDRGKGTWKGYSEWLNTDHDILDHGFIELMGTGGREEDGVLPGWAVKWILTQDHRMWEIMLNHGNLAGGIPGHWRETDGSGTGTGGHLHRYPFGEDGHVISIQGRPTVWANRTNDDYRGKAEDRLPSPDLGEQTATWSTQTWAHFPSLAYMPYLVTGERYYLDELYYIANQTAAGTNYEYRGRDAGIVSDQVRGEAWKLRDILHAASMAPDDETEKAYFERWIPNNIQAHTETVQSYAPIHWWGVQYAGNEWGVSHQHAPWESDFVLTVLAHARELGYDSAEMNNLFSTFSSFLINRCTHQDFNRFNVGLYVYPAKNTQGEDFTSWGELDALTRTVADWNELPSPDNTNSYRYFALGAASTITNQSPSEAPHGDGQDAYQFLNNHVDGGDANQNTALALNPTWALVPRSDTSDSSRCGDGVCDASESCHVCSADCGTCSAYCGDGACNGSETCSSCSADCGSCSTGGAAGGLIAHYKFDKGSGTAASDSSGNGNHGNLINNPTWTTGKVGQALSFDESDDYVEVSDSSSLDNITDAATFSFWLNRVGQSNGDIPYIDKFSDGSKRAFAVWSGHESWNEDEIRIMIANNDGSGVQLDEQTSSLHIPENEWTHIVATWDKTRGNAKVYVNGNLEETLGSGATASMSTNSQKLKIGRDYNDGDQFEGQLDEVRIYNRALSEQEVQELYTHHSLDTGEGTRLRGDINGDGSVNAADFGAIVNRWWQQLNIGAEDLNTNGRVDTPDIGIIMSNWGQ